MGAGVVETCSAGPFGPRIDELVEGVAWPARPAYILDRQIPLFEKPRAIGFGDGRFAVLEIGHDVANAVIVENHYSRKVYAASRIHLAVAVDARLFGVLQFGHAMNPASQDGVVAGTAMDEYLELNRMWLHDAAERNSESRALSYAIKFIRRAHPKIRWIQSFADERCQRLGVVYQAANFRYLGEHRSVFWELDGVVYHNSIMTRLNVLTPAAANLQANRHRAVAREYRQFRYIFFMAPRFAKGLRHPVLPPPKA